MNAAVKTAPEWLLACLLPLISLACAEDESGDAFEEVGEAPSPLAMNLQREIEPNDVMAAATPLPGRAGVVRAPIYVNTDLPTLPDVDNYSFTANAGDRLYAAVYTGAAPVPDSNSPPPIVSRDSLLTILAPDGTTVVEADDNNGSFSPQSSAVAGVTLLTTGTYFIRVQHATNSNRILPYDLHYQLRSGAAPLEAEPNNTFMSGNILLDGIVGGALATSADVDTYRVDLNAGDTLFASLDLDPERDLTDTSAQLQVGPAGALSTANSVGGAGPDAEANFFTAKTPGTYAIVVSGTGPGSYVLSATIHPATSLGASCTTYSSSTPIPIGTGPGTVTATITIPDSFEIADVDVGLSLDHAKVPDLDISLTAPQGNEVVLLTDVGSIAQPSWDFTLDQEAAQTITAGSNPPVSGRMQPETATEQGRLHWFYGQRSDGVWTLNVRDDEAGGGGTLNSFDLTLCRRSPPPTCANGGAPTVVYATDFETDDAGFTHSGQVDEWGRGLPSGNSAPIVSCNSGVACFKTDLTGTYNPSNNSLVSPVIDLTNAVAPVRARWAMKYQMEGAEYDLFTVIARQTGGGPLQKKLFEWQDMTMQVVNVVGSPAVVVAEAAGWAFHEADLSDFVGTTVELVFRVDGDGVLGFSGVAVDDVMVTHCFPQVCGNGIVQPPEICDDNNLVSGDGCDADCTPSACGNGIVAGAEGCDDGNLTNGDGCDSNCTPTGCGNGVVRGAEGCDDGNLTNGDGCDANCTPTSCGNGVTAGVEQCDDANEVEGDGCDSNCTPTGCGNGVADPSEACDDGGLANGDGCDSNCTSTGCGNAVVTAGEACDDGNIVEGDGCDSNCLASGCGNGVVGGAEECDDGNDVSGDGCDINCTESGCGNGVLSSGEDCEDGNDQDGDGCSADCEIESNPGSTCGDGVQDDGEECDDGDTKGDDGCSAACTLESVPTDDTEDGCGCRLEVESRRPAAREVTWILFALIAVVRSHRTRYPEGRRRHWPDRG